MGIQSNTGSYSRFRVDREIRTDFRETLVEQVARGAFRAISKVSEDERSAGWTSISNPFHTDLGEDDIFFGETVLLGMRVDRRVVPPRVLKHHVRQEELRVMEEGGREGLSKQERRDIKSRVKSRLLQGVLPGISTYDIIWFFGEGTLLFGATAEKPCNEFTELFEASFDAGLTRQFAFSAMAESLKGGAEALERLQPSRLY